MKCEDLNSKLDEEFLNRYKVIKLIGKGGNGEVWEIKRKADGKYFAFKCLYKNGKISKQRFINEIETIKKFSSHKNIITIIEADVSRNNICWYIMPLGKTIGDFFSNNNVHILMIFNHIKAIAIAIKALHDEGYCHRDIEPNNILVVDGIPKLADFGLVWHEGFEKCTGINEKVGAQETIAPEMREHLSELKHSPKADVYSFAKTTWMLVTNRKRAFLGQYHPETLGYLKPDDAMINQGIRTFSRLNSLLTTSTATNPLRRPGMDIFISEIETFLKDNQGSETEIEKKNEIERIKNSLVLNDSDMEIYSQVEKITRILLKVIDGKRHGFRELKDDNTSEVLFYINNVIYGGYGERIFLFNEINAGKFYLLKVEKISINKRDYSVVIECSDIKMDDIKEDESFDYVDFNQNNNWEKYLVADIGIKGEKKEINIMTIASTYIIN